MKEGGLRRRYVVFALCLLFVGSRSNEGGCSCGRGIGRSREGGRGGKVVIPVMEVSKWSLRKQVVELSIPVSLTMMTFHFMTIVDMIMVSRNAKL